MNRGRKKKIPVEPIHDNLEPTPNVSETIRPTSETGDAVSMSIPEGESKAGKKIAVINEDGINRPLEQKSKKVKAPAYFIPNDAEIKVEVDILFRLDNGQIVNATLREPTFNYDYSMFENNEYVSHRTEWFLFSYPRYSQVNILRQSSLRMDKETGKMTVDPIDFRQKCLTYFLKDWSLVDENGEKIPLKFTEDGNLNYDTLQMIYAFSTGLIDVVMTKFETESSLG